jgi:uncharacterized protein YndB with AHSA1/START domain
VSEPIVLERTYPASPARIWELWTTPAGIESWWAPDGFEAEVIVLDLRVGGELRHALTATGPEQVAFMRTAGLPLRTEATKTFTELQEGRRLGYRSLIDFVPGVEPYEHLTTIDLEPVAEGTRIAMAIEPLHDEEWTERLVLGRANELDNLGRLLAGERP